MSGMASSRFVVFTLLLSLGTFLYASPTGSISGTLKDPSGAVVPGARLTLINKATGAHLSATSDPNGSYQFPQLTPAEYTLSAEASGFKKAAVGSVIVEVDQVTHVDFALQVGNVTETIEVSSAAPLLEVDKSTLSSVVESKVISSMPLNARQYLDLALITPGALPAATGTQGGGFNVGGARSQSNIFLLDGISNIDTQVNSALGNFRITDAVQEFAVQTSVATAEFGRGTGAEVSIVTKSGGNQFHGSVFEYLRNSKLDAADFFTNRNGAPKNPLHRNQYGATFGGPIRKDKTFFFLNWEDFRQVAPTPSLTRVPSVTERASVVDPISKALLQFWPDPNIAGAAPGSNNFIANVRASTFDHTGLVKIDHNLTSKDHIQGRWAEYEGTTFTPGKLPSLGGNANEPISRSGVFTETHTFTPSLLNEFRFGFSRNQTKISVQDQGFDASKVFVGANGQPLAGIVAASQNLQDSGLPTVGISGFASLGSTSNLPQGRITNTYELFDNVSVVAPFGASRHSFRMGYHVRREDARRYLDGSARGVFNFSNFTDFAAGLVNTSTLRFGQTVRYWRRYPWDLYWQDTYKVKDNLTLNYGIRYEYPSAIAQTRNGATNFVPGVGPVLLDSNSLLTVDITKVGPASLVLKQAPVTLGSSGVNADKNNFAPVLGLAYTPRFAKKLFGNDDTVIRLGYRVGYDDIFNNIPANMGLNAPYTLTTSQGSTTTQGTVANPKKFSYAVALDQNVPLVKFVNGVPFFGLVSFNAQDPNLRSAYLHQYNFGIQRRIHGAFSMEVDYQGSSGHKLGLFLDQNQPSLVNGTQVFPYPTFGSISTGKDIGNSNYNAMVVTSKYQGRHGIFFQGSYTVGKSIDYNSAFFGSSGEAGNVADATHINLDRGPSSFDIRHRVVLTYVVELPVGPGHRLLGWNNGFNRQVFGGWQISGVTTLQTGAPFTVFNGSTDFSGFNNGGADRPDLLGSGAIQQDNHNVDNAFDIARFGCTLNAKNQPSCPSTSAPPRGRVGTSGRNQYYGPALANYNFALNKKFALWSESRTLQFGADFFNLFNHTNFSNPDGSQSSGTFGKITSTVGSATATAVGTSAGFNGGGPRVIQLSLRFSF